MIKANEIRIGNAIWDDTAGKVRFVTHRIISDIASSADPLPYSPIPLTAEWLEKFGFDKITEGGDNFCDEYLKSPVLIHYDGEDFWFGFDAGPKLRRNFAITYLHQLQNLYYVLTGEELTIKETV